MYSGVASYHVYVEDGDTETKVILIEDAFEFLVQQSCAFGKARASPWVKGAALELNKGIGCGWTLLKMECAKVIRKCIIGPHVWMGA